MKYVVGTLLISEFLANVLLCKQAFSKMTVKTWDVDYFLL